jgi:hypothetical protein
MTTNKDFKRLVRGRMLKTGESYTAARSHFLRSQKSARRPGGQALSRSSTKPDYAKLAGMSDATIKEKTGCSWEKWTTALDYVKAYEWSHRAIAEYVHQTFKVPGWWTQTVTVGYERIRGLRAIGQRRGGEFEANKSKTFPVAVSRLFRAFKDKRSRNRWLPGIDLTVKTAIKDRSMRMAWSDGKPVEAWFVTKGPRKSSVSIAHRKLEDKATADQVKADWTGRLDSLGKILQ